MSNFITLSSCWLLLAILEFSIRIWVIRYHIRKYRRWPGLLDIEDDLELWRKDCNVEDIGTIAIVSMLIVPYIFITIIFSLFGVVNYIIRKIREFLLEPVVEVVNAELLEAKSNYRKLGDWKKQAKKNDMSLEEFVCSPAFKEYVEA